MIRLIRLLIIATASLASAGWAEAAEAIIVRAEPAYMQELAVRFGLTILQQIPNQPVFLVQIPVGASKETVKLQLINYDHGGDADNDDDDDDDVLTENNDTFSLPEPDPNGAPIAGSNAPVLAALANPAYTQFYGDTVWTGMINQPALARIRVTQARQLATGAGIVAIIDTGVDPGHPFLQRWLTNGYDFVRDHPGIPSELDDLDPATRGILSPYTTAILDTTGIVNPYTTAILDRELANRLNLSALPGHFGHGTMVAGLVRAVAPTARLMPLKAFEANGRGTLWNVLRAIYYAQANGAKVINLSLGFAESHPELQRAVEFVSAQGVTCVASAGNQSSEAMFYPAGYKEAFGIAATNIDDYPAIFTNYGDNLVTIAAPGEALIVPYPGGRYAAAWGTSFSAPLVSGTVALIHQLKPSLNWEKVQDALKEAAPVLGGDLGDGRLDVNRAVRKAREL